MLFSFKDDLWSKYPAIYRDALDKRYPFAVSALSHICLFIFRYNYPFLIHVVDILLADLIGI